jgi:hypothetical protein
MEAPLQSVTVGASSGNELSKKDSFRNLIS